MIFIILSGKEIKKRMGEEIEITPFNKEQLNPNSYNVKLNKKLLVYENNILDMKKENKTKEIIIPEDGYLLKPNKLYLGRTVEYTKTDKFVPMLEGRSSIGRLGLNIHATAGFGDVGYSGFWTLELSCVQPVRIYPGVEIGQIFYYSLKGDYVGYGIDGKYQNNKDVQPSFLYKDFQ